MAELPRVELGKVQSGLSLPRVTPGTAGKGLSDLGDEILGYAKAKQDINDTIEANELLAEHSIKARELQSTMLRSDIREDQLAPTYEKAIGDLNQEITNKARSQNVRDMLAQNLPSRTAAKVNEIQSESDRRFTATALAGYERALTLNTRDYAGATTDAQRAEIKDRHLKSLEVLSRMGIFDADRRQKEADRFSRQVELFDVERALNKDPEAGMEAITDPKKFLEKYPNVKIDDLDNIFTKSVQIEERQRTLLKQRRKDAQDEVVGIIDESVIRGKMDFDKLDNLRDRKLISPEDYRRSALALQKQSEEGGVDDPKVKGEFETMIRQWPQYVTESNLITSFNNGFLSRKGLNELLDLKQKWTKAKEDEADKVDPRLKGPLYTEGKSKIDQVVGKGLTISGVAVDDNTRRRWGAAMDEYLERVVKERDKSHAQIADEIVQRYQGAAKPAEVVPFKYQDPKKPSGVDLGRLKQDYLKEKDPRERERIMNLMRRLKEFDDQTSY